MSFHDPKPVRKCACGKPCQWCLAANKARAAFPNATVPPKHDADTEHLCVECFMKHPDLKTLDCRRPGKP